MSPPPELAAVLDPSSVAIIGASDNPHKVGGRPLQYLMRFGWDRPIYPINRERDRVQGCRAYPDLSALPGRADLVVIAVPAGQAIAAVDASAAHGARMAVVMAAGFAETRDPEAGGRQADMVRRARTAGMRIIGPNSQGVANFANGLVASFSTMFQDVEPLDGQVAILSQSGIMSAMPFGLLRARGIGVRHAHATGNEADVTVPELVQAVLHDREVRLILLYVESIRDPDTLALAAAEARRRDVPIVAVKAGRTPGGREAARTHTAALADDDRVVDAFLRHLGIWRVADIHELVATTELYLKGWRPRRGRLVVVSNSGASGVMAADTVRDAGVDLCAFDSPTQRRLAAQLPEFAAPANPVDLTGALLNDSTIFRRVLNVLGEVPDADLFLFSFPVSGKGYDVAELTEAARAFEAQHGRPVVVAAPQTQVVETFRAAGLITFENQTDAIRSLAQLVHHTRAMSRARREGMPPATSRLLPESDGRFCDEAESLAVLAAAGFPVVPHRLCASAADVGAAFTALGPRVVVKACSKDVPHKAALGLVRLAIDSEPAALAAFADLHARMATLDVRASGVLVQRMVPGCREIVLGARLDPTVGPVVLVGDGGRDVELRQDVALLIPPFTVDDVGEAIGRLRIAPLFAAGRHDPVLDVEALCDLAVSLGDFIVAAAGRIASLDLNPVMVGEAGRGVVIVDAVLEPARPHPAGAPS